MKQTVRTGEYFHKGAEIHYFHNLTFIDLVYLCLLNDFINHLEGNFRILLVNRRNRDLSFIIHIDPRTGYIRDISDRLATWTNKDSDLFRPDVKGDNNRRIFGHMTLWLRDGLFHLIEDKKPAFFRLFKCLLHYLSCNALNLYIHLQGRNTIAGTCYLEIHIPVMVFIT